MNRLKLFEQIYGEILDYSDRDTISLCAKRGLDTFELLEKSGRSLLSTNTRDDSAFIYAVSTAVIVGQFGNIAFGDHNLFEEHEIDLAPLHLEVEDIKGYLDGYPDTISVLRFETLRDSGHINMQDIWETIFEYNKETHRGLCEFYKQQGKEDPNYEIYSSLVKIFETRDEDGEIIMPNFASGGETGALAFVSIGFQW